MSGPMSSFAGAQNRRQDLSGLVTEVERRFAMSTGTRGKRLNEFRDRTWAAQNEAHDDLLLILHVLSRQTDYKTAINTLIHQREYTKLKTAYLSWEP